MEKVMSVEERIKRAEDIYNRRNGYYSRIIPNSEKNENKSKKGSIKKLLMQAFICLLIYIVFYAVTNREYVFSEEFRNQVNVFFTEKTKISEWYLSVKGFINDKINDNNGETKEKAEETTDEAKTEETKPEEENATEELQNNKGEKEEGENIGGAVEESQAEKKEEPSEQDLLEKEASEIKKKISFIKPIEGRISSTFGWRNPTTESVPKYHTGIDIAANEGTVIKSATDGKVIMASNTGDYGNHYQIQVDDIILVYAHCKKLYFKEGDTIKQGQEIGEVGSTGNSTGPHLHFEIRKGDTKIDPQLILNF